MTRFVPDPATATNNPNSFAQHTEVHVFVVSGRRNVQFIPLGLVITLFVEEPTATAANNPNSADQHTDHQSAVPEESADALGVQVIPSELVMTWFDPDAFDATATNNPNSGDQHTDLQSINVAVLLVQVIPSGLVITRVPLNATATNKPNSGDQQIERKSLLGVVLLVHVETAFTPLE